MASMQVEAGSAIAQSIQVAAQAKLMEAGWAAEENDTTLSEYVTMMLVNGKDFQGVQAELGGDLLGVGEDDPAVAEFTGWLFQHAQALSGQGAPVQQQEQNGSAMNVEGEPQQIQSVQDEQMGDAVPAVDGAPSGPKAMRNGSDSTRGRGRGGRLLGQMNRNMDRSQDDPLRRIKGAASGGIGRIDAHAGRAARGSRGQNVANGVQRMVNGGRGGHPGAMAQQINPMMPQQAGGLGQLDSSTQMQFMQMMEMQATMMANMLQNGGQMPNMNGGANNFQSKPRGGKSLFDRMDNKRGRGNSSATFRPNKADHEGMDIDKPLTDISKPAFDTMCKFNLRCQNPTCPFAHQSPANTRSNLTLDMADTCSYGIACTNNKCSARHPSSAQRNGGGGGYGGAAAAGFGGAGGKADVDCKFWPNCNVGPACPFRHPTTVACRNGADCKVEGCTFAHSGIPCRYNPCTRPDCPYKHAAGQRRGTFEDKVWSAEGGEPVDRGTGKMERFAELKASEGQAEELIVPDGGASQQEMQNGGGGGGNDGDGEQLMAETQIVS